jgi:hypothetical protein
MRVSPLLVTLTCTACAKAGLPEAAPDAAVSERREGGLIGQDIDLDGNGVADIRNVFRDRASARGDLLRKEIDLNRDGLMDVISFLGPDGHLAREDMDSDWDGTFDLTDHYQKGVRVLSEYDTDHDGRPNVFKYYVRGPEGSVYLDRKERDEDGDGKIDVWERFSAGGALIRAGRDLDGDGKVDVRDE